MTDLQQRYEAETGQSIRRHPMERKLNEQWIRHGVMYKAIKKGERCVVACGFMDETVPDGLTFIELGSVDEEGLLPCPFCGKYPTIVIDPWGMYWISHECNLIKIHAGAHAKTNLQDVLDDWNRRA